MNINLLQNSKQETFPGQILVRGQFLDPEQPGEKSDNSNILNNIEEKTKILKSAINAIQPKEREKYLVKPKKSNSNENNGLELETLNCKLDEEDEIKEKLNNIQNTTKYID